MKETTFGFIGLGLIGGSIAKSLRRQYADNATIIAYDINKDELLLSAEDGVIDMYTDVLDDLDLSHCDYLFLCAPIKYNDQNLTLLKDRIPATCLITDVGSVKADIHKKVKELGLEKQFIGGHPMAGSEKTGFSSSNERVLENAYYILTPTESIPTKAVLEYKELVTCMGAIPLILSWEEHDYVTAAISHLPHIIAAALVNLVKDSDSKDGIMKLIAAGGFKDITRIASSSPLMWQQISIKNRNNISQLLEDYISSLSSVLHFLEESDEKNLFQLFDFAKTYRESFADTTNGPIKKIHLIYVDIPDEPGVIATIATLLAVYNISLKNIGIVHNREFEEGVLRIEFYDENATLQSAKILQNKGYSVSVR